MKKLYLLVFVGLASLASAQSNPEDEIPIFNLDDYYVEPKFSLSVGVRALSGSKTSFGGHGLVESVQNSEDEFATNVIRYYNDGTVSLDARIDATDGKTNTWLYVDAKQLIDADTNLAFHTYSAQTSDTTRSKDPGLSLGTELVVSREMGSIGKHITWKIFAGVGMNGIGANLRDNIAATITTVTDTYGLDGQTLPGAVPYVAPVNSIDVDGNATDVSVLLGRKPDSRTVSTTVNDTQVSSFWKLKGTYITLRLGPTFIYSITDNFRLSFSAGPSLVYSAVDYSVEQEFTVETGSPIITTLSETEGKNLTGYYVDTTLEYMFTETAGLYMGAFYQTSGDYTQTISNTSATYTTDIDLSSLQGFRAGLNFKF